MLIIYYDSLDNTINIQYCVLFPKKKRLNYKESFI